MPPNNHTEVPCDGCTECCRSGQALFLHPDQGDDLESYQVRIIAQPNTGDGTGQDAGGAVFLLATKENGECFYLGPSGCTIYERRPLLCRSFDCRKHFLILSKQDRNNLVALGLSSKAVFEAGRLRVKTLSPAERKECADKRREFFS